MKPFRKHVAIAIDGGGIRGIIATQALMRLEQHLGRPAHDVFRLAAGTSTGAIISAGIATGHSAAEMTQLYAELGPLIFRRTWRNMLWPLVRYRYVLEPFVDALKGFFGSATMDSIWNSAPRRDVVITAFDLATNHTCFIKPWKPQYAAWPIAQAVATSCSVPTYFPPVENRYVDGGVGAYTNPCYLAAYEVAFYLSWQPADTTLISLGTGRTPQGLHPEQISRFWPWNWIGPVLGAFLQSADDQQVHLVDTFFDELDFRRFQVDLLAPYEMDDASHISELMTYGDALWNKIVNDEIDPIQEIKAGHLIERQAF
jgi:predicted acylesterase/phospholipase RssA